MENGRDNPTRGDKRGKFSRLFAPFEGGRGGGERRGLCAIACILRYYGNNRI